MLDYFYLYSNPITMSFIILFIALFTTSFQYNISDRSLSTRDKALIILISFISAIAFCIMIIIILMIFTKRNEKLKEKHENLGLEYETVFMH